MSNLFEKRFNYKPFEYPEVLQFIELMNKTYWVHSEVDFTADVQDFKVKLTDKEKKVMKKSLLGIAQVEVAVKTFWGDLYKTFPKPEINGLGMTFGESEWRHSEAYSRLLDVLGYNDEFENLLEIPVFKEKLKLLDESLNSKNIVNKLLFFTIVIENSSLFSQFANIVSFSRFKGIMKNTANMIAWTSNDERVHALAGIYLIKKLKEEGFIDDNDLYQLRNEVKKYIVYEEKLLNWIYEDGELQFFTKEDMLNFMKRRIDDSLIQLNIKPIFNISDKQYKAMEWYDEETLAPSLDDFFAKRPVEYTKHDKSITGNDLF